jgi:outer membrane murein-binding lipoprotein Lpp
MAWADTGVAEEQKMPDTESRLIDLEQKVQALTDNQDAIVADAAKVPESLGLNFRLLNRNIDAKFAAQDRKIDRLQTDVADLKIDVADLKTDVADLKTDVGDLKTDVAAILRILGEQFKPKA